MNDRELYLRIGEVIHASGAPNVHPGPDQWGDTITQCPRCGNHDINQILVWYRSTRSGQKGLTKDIAPVSTFLFERHQRAKLSSAVIDRLTCLQCADEGRGEVEIPIRPLGPYEKE